MAEEKQQSLREVLGKKLYEYYDLSGVIWEEAGDKEEYLNTADDIISALHAWAGSGLLTEEERKAVDVPCVAVCGQDSPDFESQICWDCIVYKFCKTQALKTKLEYE